MSFLRFPNPSAKKKKPAKIIYILASALIDNYLSLVILTLPGSTMQAAVLAQSYRVVASQSDGSLHF